MYQFWCVLVSKTERRIVAMLGYGWDFIQIIHINIFIIIRIISYRFKKGLPQIET